MQAVRELLDQVAGGDGVVGAWVCDPAGSVLDSAWPNLPPDADLSAAGRSLARAGQWLSRQYGDWDMVAAQLADGVLLARNLGRGLLCIAARRMTNPAVLNARLNALVERLGKDLEGAIETAAPVTAPEAVTAEQSADAIADGRETAAGGASRRADPVSQRAIDDLVRALAEHIGPAAGVLAGRTRKQMGLVERPLPRGRFSEFVRLLQERIENERGRQEFRQAVRRIRQLYDV